jgi:hypothetical protein
MYVLAVGDPKSANITRLKLSPRVQIAMDFAIFCNKKSNPGLKPRPLCFLQLFIQETK